MRKAELQRHTEVQRRNFAATEPLGIGTWRDKEQKRWQYFIQGWIDPTWASGESLLKSLSLRLSLPLRLQLCTMPAFFMAT